MIVDFSGVPAGTEVHLLNLGPDEPFGGGVPGERLRAVGSRHDRSGDAVRRRGGDLGGHVHPAPVPEAAGRSRTSPGARRGRCRCSRRCRWTSTTRPWRPCWASCRNGRLEPKMWHEPITENPALGSTEVWEMFNATADAHPIHIHEVQFQVVNRQRLRIDADSDEVVQPVETVGAARPREPLGGRVQGHGDLVPGRGDEGAAEVPDAGQLRLALPHRLARGQRDDAALPDRPGAAGVAGRRAEH